MIIGPNAKIATYHGGGSASLASYYAVTPFDGIKEKLESEPEYTVGQYSHKMLPPLGFSTKSTKGNPGMTMKIYNEAPDVKNRKPFQELEIPKTDIFLVDFHHPDLKSELFYATVEGSLTAEEDCTYELGLVVVGSGNLYVNGELTIENTTRQTLGDAFFGGGTVEEKGFYKMQKGKAYDIKVEFGSTPTSKLSDQAVLNRGGAIRIGGCKVLDPKAEIERAAALAKDADQVIVCAGLSAVSCSQVQSFHADYRHTDNLEGLGDRGSGPRAHGLAPRRGRFDRCSRQSQSQHSCRASVRYTGRDAMGQRRQCHCSSMVRR